MTNAMIILNESIKLMKQGILTDDGTSRYIVVEKENGEKEKVFLPEEIHTFANWKSLGYSVKKGEKAIASFPIWKYKQKFKKNDDGTIATDENGDEISTDAMFLKMSYFFKKSQVEPTDPEKEKRIQAAREARKNAKSKKASKQPASEPAVPLLLPAHMEQSAPAETEIKSVPAPAIKAKKVTAAQIKNACKRINKGETGFTPLGQFSDGKKNYITDGKQAIISAKRFAEISELDENINSGLKKTLPATFSKILTDAESAKHELQLPTLDEIKQIKRDAKNHGVKIATYDFGNDLPIVNVEFLENVILALGGKIVKAVTNGMLKPLTFYAENGDIGILLPMRKTVKAA